MNKKKIAILGIKFFPSQGGTSRVSEDLVTQLHERYEFTMYCYKHPKAENYIPGVKVVAFPKLPGGVIGVFLFYLRCTLHMLRTGDFDLVHVHKTDAAFFIPMLARKFKVVATSHEAPYKRDKWSGFTKRYFRWMENIFMKSDAHLTSISAPLSQYYLEKFGRNVQYIPNGVDIHMNPDFDAADRLLAQHQIDGPFIFFAARRVMATKGPHHMLKALKRIDYKGHIVIAGDTTELPAFTRELEELSKGLKVHFIGMIRNKDLLMAMVQRAERFIFPSETEGMSIMLLEVTNLGTPIIASDIPENTAVFDEQDMLFFRNKDVEDLAEKFLWAEANPEVMHQRALHAQQRVATEYNRELIAEQYAEMYDALMGIEKVS
ncbi:MAG: glycosyltransferase family 4 protein [Bacteroidota bacterium]